MGGQATAGSGKAQDAGLDDERPYAVLLTCPDVRLQLAQRPMETARVPDQQHIGIILPDAFWEVLLARARLAGVCVAVILCQPVHDSESAGLGVHVAATERPLHPNRAPERS